MSDTVMDNAQTDSLRDRVLNMAKHGEATDLLEVWTEVISDPPADQEFYTQLVRARATTYDPSAMLELFVQLVRALEERQEWQIILRVVTAVAPHWPDNDVFRQAAYLALQDKYADHPNIDRMLEATRLDACGPIDQGLKRFRALLRLSPGRVFQHATWGVGVVKNLDLDLGKVTFDFPAEKGRVLTIAGVRDFLTYLPPTHVLARRATDPDALTALGEDDPAALVRVILESYKGRIKQGEMKTMLLGGVFTESRWTNWWTRARAALKMDPMVDFDKGGAHAEIVLRNKPKSFEQEVEDLFFSPDSELAERIAAIKKLEAAAATSTPSTEALGKMLRALNEEYRQKRTGLSVADRVQMAYLARDIERLGEGLAADTPFIPSPEEALADVQDDYAPLTEMSSEEHAMEALRFVMERDGDSGFELAAHIFAKAPGKLAQAIWKTLDADKHKDLAVHAVQNLFERPLVNPQTYFWVIKQIGDKNWPHLQEYFPLSQVVPDVLDNLETWDKLLDHPSVDRGTQATAKALVSKIKTQLEAKGFAMLCAAVMEMDLDAARRFRRSLQTHNSLPENYKSAAERQVVLTRRELEDEQAAPLAGGSKAQVHVQEEGGGLHYCTPVAREMKFRELDELMTIKIPENSREIEKARSEGDLKENAGYIYAKEQQKLLMQQSLGLQQLLQTARVFEASKVTTSSIGFGVAFVAENLKKNNQETYTVLGQFETDPDRNIISYQSPFMKQFIGKKVGEEVVISHPDGSETPYKVLSTSDALAGGDWEVPPENE